ncbi:hypothetical protein SAMN05421803_11319 [Nocardiopsis flavescens]|uniref:Uncharacterized protein n=1 Tax=Nocardiopsis flavescens TaxID=758803 RepID=A0A1M6PC59_9ACTN|nr:hypothetical protein SAMN05421803_11319 [Nocardiopsis flavescens]
MIYVVKVAIPFMSPVSGGGVEQELADRPP